MSTPGLALNNLRTAVIVIVLAVPSWAITMQYRGVEYSVVQSIEGNAWRWEVHFDGGKYGATPISRAYAIKIAEREIDRFKDRQE